MENLGVDIKLLFAQLVNFLAFFLVYKKFIAKNFLNFLGDEKKRHESLASLDQEIVKKRQELEEERKKLKAEIRKETEALRRNILSEVESQKNKILEDAKKEALLIKQQAKSRIDEERVKMEAEFRKKISDTIIASIEFALKDFLTEEQQRQITSRALKNFKNPVN
jgi:F0F1-type ATP synthase membrane subunit b/b'